MAHQETEWLKVWGSPKSTTDTGKKHLEDYLDGSGRYWSTPSTPTGKTRFSHDPSFDSARHSHDKPNIMTKVHAKAKKWKQVLPYIRKHLHGQAHENEQRQGLEIDKGKSATTSAGSGDGGNVEGHGRDYFGAPMYNSDIAPKLNKQQSMIQQRSTMSPPQLARCKSYRPRPGVKSGIEEVQVHDMTRTKSDPAQLIKPVRLDSSEYQPTSFSFPTSPEIQELDDSEQTLFSNRKLEQTRYPSSLSPRFVGFPSSLSPRLVINTQDDTPRASEACLSNSSNSRMIYRNNSNEMPFTDYNIIVEEINEILDSPSSLISKAPHNKTDSTDERQPMQDHQQHSSICQATSFSSSPELNRYNKTESSRDNSGNMLNNRKDAQTNTNESPTHKVLLEVAHKIADSQVVTNQELKLNGFDDCLKVSFAPIETKPTISRTEIQVSTYELDNSKFESPRTTPFDNSNVASKVATFTRIMETTNKDVELTQKLGMNMSDQVYRGVTSQLTSEIIAQTCKTNSNRTDNTIEAFQIIAEPQPQELNSTSLPIGKPINLKSIATKLETNNPKESNDNPTNQDDYKTVTEAVSEILSPAYHAVSDAANKIVESALIGTKKVAKSVSDNNSNPNTDASDDGDYKTVTEAVGEMLTPVYSAVSQATNKVAGKGYQKGISFRDYLKGMAVVGNTRSNNYSSVRNEEVPGSPVPVSRNPYIEESEEVEGNGRRLQPSTNWYMDNNYLQIIL